MNSNIVKELIYYANSSVPASKNIGPVLRIHYELTFILDGAMTYYVDDEPYTIKKNDVILIKPGMFIYRPKGTTPVSYVSFNFTVHDSDPLPDEIHIKKIITPFIKNIVHAFPYKNNTTLLNHSRQKLANILNIILLEIIDEQAMQSRNKYIQQIITYINDNITEPLTLKDISHHVHLSDVYTSKLFKKEMNISLFDYINKSKMELANNMIMTDNTDLKSIAAHLGFSDYCYFSRIYKKIYGCSPSKQRKLLTSERNKTKNDL